MSKRAEFGAELVVKARRMLSEAWAQAFASAKKAPLKDTVPALLREDITRSINSPTKSYRYVLPTQVCAKLANSDLDCRCPQAARQGEGSFDARSIAHEVIVRFDQANNSVLGGSPEPYVNNPLRVQEVSKKFRKPQKNKGDWDALCRVLAQVEDRNSGEFTKQVFFQVLTEVHRRLAEVHVAYPAPKRISLDEALRILTEFLAVTSGGDRLLAQQRPSLRFWENALSCLPKCGGPT